MKFNLKIIIPNKVYFDNKIDLLYLKTNDDYLSILPNHAALITNVKKSYGFIKINNIKKKFLFYNGFLFIDDDHNVELIIENIEII